MLGIIDSDKNRDLWEQLVPEGVKTIFSEYIPIGCGTIIVNADYMGDQLGDIIARAKAAGTEVAVAAQSPDADEQDRLFALGADDVLSLPLGMRTAEKRIKTYRGAASSEAASGLNMESIMHITEDGRGSYQVPEEEFESIYRFVLRILGRVGSGAQVIVVKLERPAEAEDEAGRVMEILSRAVHNCLRRGDMTAVCGRDKVLVLLIGANDDGGHLAVNRLVNSFYSECTDSRFELSYDMKTVGEAD
ncbi:MAG: hypothetical protein IJM44_06480 [Ruminococcus sp.]|nr:hypothetical protein [Ruminococcus sp.]